ncbi:hypothetical protein HPB47_022738 [Ixodes persulcatus]|uniref:Uncharacterized protein n=1 Tax=Ixodes persulcatus TaxID=34615 RepID=A0AC60QB73_IXOPE|nr:hypothetical protein HPB47_022738 [Ixodes persulcatus]
MLLDYVLTLVCSEVVHPPSTAHGGRGGAEAPGWSVWDFPSWSPPVAGGCWTFWFRRLPDRLTTSPSSTAASSYRDTWVQLHQHGASDSLRACGGDCQMLGTLTFLFFGLVCCDNGRGPEHSASFTVSADLFVRLDGGPAQRAAHWEALGPHRPQHRPAPPPAGFISHHQHSSVIYTSSSFPCTYHLIIIIARRGTAGLHAVSRSQQVEVNVYVDQVLESAGPGLALGGRRWRSRRHTRRGRNSHPLQPGCCQSGGGKHRVPGQPSAEAPDGVRVLSRVVHAPWPDDVAVLAAGPAPVEQGPVVGAVAGIVVAAPDKIGLWGADAACLPHLQQLRSGSLWPPGPPRTALSPLGSTSPESPGGTRDDRSRGRHSTASAGLFVAARLARWTPESAVPASHLGRGTSCAASVADCASTATGTPDM